MNWVVEVRPNVRHRQCLMLKWVAGEVATVPQRDQPHRLCFVGDRSCQY